MKRMLWGAVLLIVVVASNCATAVEPQTWVDGLPDARASVAHCDPYVDYN
jgi:hypothetical protein